MEKNLEEIQKESIQKMTTETPQKKKRGRPKKSTTTTNQITTNEEKRESGLKLTFKTLFEFLGKTLAITLSFKKFEISDPESDLLASQADEVIVEFAPQIENKWAKLGVFITSILAIFGKRYFEFEKEKAEKNKKENTPDQLKIAEVKDGI